MSRGSCRKFGPFLCSGDIILTIRSAEEDPDEYPFPLTLRTKQAGAAGDEPATAPLNGS